MVSQAQLEREKVSLRSRSEICYGVVVPDLSFEEAVSRVQGVSHPRELFGDDETQSRLAYRAFARRLHPDVVEPTLKDRASVATALLNSLWDSYKKTALGTFEIATRRRSYTVESLLLADEISNLYPVSWSDGDDHYGMLRLPRSPKNNDLVETEAKAIKVLDASDPTYRVYAPTLVESFRYRDTKTRVERRANVTERLDGFVTIKEVHNAFPAGLNGRDVAWIWRRLLAGAGWFHRAGLVNAAVLPEHILVHPLKHGVVFSNWCYSTELDHPLRAVSPNYRDWYPQDVLAKKPASAKTDIHLISHLMGWLLGPNASSQFKAFIQGCTLRFGGVPDAWEIQRDFDDLLFRLYGQRKYRPLVMPV